MFRELRQIGGAIGPYTADHYANIPYGPKAPEVQRLANELEIITIREFAVYGAASLPWSDAQC